MKPVTKNGTNNEIASAIHLEFIQNLAESNEPDAANKVADYHEAVFLNYYGADRERFKQQTRTHEDRLSYLETKLRDSRDLLSEMDRLVLAEGEKSEPSMPWTAWDVTMFVLSALSVVALLAFGVMNVSFNLLESGIVTFQQNPMRAYLWAALLPVGALSVKIGWDFIQSPGLRHFFLWSCLTTGIVSVLVWVLAYASIYPTLSKTTEEHLQSLSVFDSETANVGTEVGLASRQAKQLDRILVSAQALAEICLSAVLGIYMTILYGRHRPNRLAHNPEFQQWDQERIRLESEVSQEREALASVLGQETRLRHQLYVFTAFARNLYEKEVLLRHDQSNRKRQLLEKIEDQLKTQLEEVQGQHRGSRFPESNAAVS